MTGVLTKTVELAVLLPKVFLSPFVNAVRFVNNDSLEARSKCPVSLQLREGICKRHLW